MDYKDPGVGMTDTYALLAAGVVGTVCAGLILAMPLWLQEQRTFKLALGTQKSEVRELPRASAYAAKDENANRC